MTQTSTEAPTPDGGAMFPPGRYGRRRESTVRRRRWVTPVVGLAIVAVMGLIAVKLYFEYGNDDFTANVTSYTNITDRSVTVKFSVSKPDGVAGTCTVQAFTFDDQQIGEAQVPVPASGTNSVITYKLATTEKAYIAEVPGCQRAN